MSHTFQLYHAFPDQICVGNEIETMEYSLHYPLFMR